MSVIIFSIKYQIRITVHLSVFVIIIIIYTYTCMYIHKKVTKDLHLLLSHFLVLWKNSPGGTFFVGHPICTYILFY